MLTVAIGQSTMRQKVPFYFRRNEMTTMTMLVLAARATSDENIEVVRKMILANIRTTFEEVDNEVAYHSAHVKQFLWMFHALTERQ